MSLARKREFGSNISDENGTPSLKRPMFQHDYIAKLFNIAPDQPHINIPRIQKTLIIGRSSSCDIRISGNDVSSKHCQLTLTSSNSKEYLNLTDISSNGVYLNDEKLGKGSNLILRSGDKLAFARTGGSYIFRYYFDLKGGTEVKKTFYEDYILGDQLGSGHYAVVKEARDRLTGNTVAVKIFHPNKSTGNIDDEKLDQEMNLLLSINHPNIVRFISRYVEPVNKYSVTTFLVLEKMNSGELFQRIINKSKLRENETMAFFEQLLSGLQYLHKNNIIHRDIKPENILLDITPRKSPNQKQTGPWDDDEYDIKVKIADFGLAKFIGELKFTNTLCGTPAYVAPEILSNQRNYSTKADLWSTGVLLYVCLCGFPPFSEELGPPNMREQIINGTYAFYSPYWDDISDSALDLISKLLVVNPESRFDITQTSEHSWFSKERTSAQKVLQSSPLQENIKRLTHRSNSQPLSLKERFESEINSEMDRSSIL